MQYKVPRREENHEEPREELKEQSPQGMTGPSSAMLKAGLEATGTDRWTGGRGTAKGKRKTLSKLTEKIKQRISYSICSENI